VAATDYSDAPLYSQALKKYLHLETAGEQYGFYASSAASIIYAGKSVIRAHHLLQASRFPAESEARNIHMAFAGAAEHHVKNAKIFARMFASKGLAVGIGAPLFYIAWFGAKHRANLKNLADVDS
jgi:hypothetical protein